MRLGRVLGMTSLPTSPSTARSGGRQLSNWRHAVGLFSAGIAPPLSELSKHAPLLIDSIHREQVAALVDRLSDELVAGSAGLAYVRGYLAARRGDLSGAMTWLTRAYAAADSTQLSSRAAAELAAIHLSLGQAVACDAVLLAAEGRARVAGVEANADLVHSRALVADHDGDRRAARALYRRALETSHSALTPFTRVVALSNLGVSVAHDDPQEALGLGEFALSALRAERLNSAIAPAIRNATGYALICLARFDEARQWLEEATASAKGNSNVRIEQYARFNLTIVDELEGHLDRARDGLEAALQRCNEVGLTELVGWAKLRIVWLAVLTGGQTPNDLLTSLRLQRVSGEFEDAVRFVEAVVALREHRYSDARRLLKNGRIRYERTGNSLHCFVSDLWLAHVEMLAGRERAARLAVTSAATLGRARGYLICPNWWDPAVVASARTLARDLDRAYLDRLFVAGRGRAVPPLPSVSLSLSGRIRVDERELDYELWRTGRTGAHVLMRFFTLLLRPYPGGVIRDELLDTLWPNSDGDRALGNLYAATHDLRGVLGSVPGVTLFVEEGWYHIRVASNVSVSHDA